LPKTCRHFIRAALVEAIAAAIREQFERLVAGEHEDAVFPPEPAETPEPAKEPERRPQVKPRPFPLPGGAAMQPPKPEAS